MSKKTVISDFSALKGKITFSEATAMQPSAKNKQSSKETKTPAREKNPAESYKALKVGQTVVLMDSDLRGKIISLGKTVTIELEDGLEIQAAYGEFAVTDQAEISALKDSRIKHKKSHTHTRPVVSRASSNQLEIDLHIEALPGGNSIPKGQQLQYQLEIFRKVIRENLSRRGMKITFIHGIGDGTLKSAIRQELDEVLALRCTYTVGDPAITVVTIK
jgi:preprotein translocase subunit YajC